jgi:hypothetical protein
MRLPRLILLLLSMGASASPAQDVRTPDAAWAYLTRRDRSDQWVVIASKKNKGYMQCQNMGEFILCPFPVWLKVLPGVKRTRPEKSRGSPFPEVPGSKTKHYMFLPKAPILKETLRRHGLKGEDVYSQAVDENGRLVGTSYEVRVVLEFGFKDFTPLVEDVLRSVWDTSKQDGYAYRLDS